MGNASGVHTIGGKEVLVVKQIGEGGNAEILLVKATKGKDKYALKRMSVHRQDKEKQLIAQWEYQISQALPAHPNLIKCEGAAQINLPNGDTEYLLLLEYCPDGTLLDWVNKDKSRSEKDILSVFAQVCAAVAVFHAHQPPISHRDLKPENVLRKEKDAFCLCDFGSASTDTYVARTAADRVTIQAIIDKNTTPSYRAPEMVDLYRPVVINQQSDIWALGVMLYQLLFKEQPFPDGTLGIASGKYRVPETHKWSKEVMELLQRMLCVDPVKRATIVEVQVAVGELIKKNPRMADPWSLPFTSATLAAASAALSAARAKSPGPELSNSHGSRNGAASPDPSEGGKKKDKGKKGKKVKPPVPAFGGDDFDAAFPAPAEGEEGKASTFISPELLKAKGIQWEEDQAEGEEKDRGERKRQEGEPAEADGEEGVREPSGNAIERPRAASFSGPPSPSPASPSPSSPTPSPMPSPNDPSRTLTIQASGLAPPNKLLGVLSPPPPLSAGSGRASRKERGQQPASGALSPVSVAATAEGGEKSAEDAAAKKKKKGEKAEKGDKGEKDKKEKKKEKKEKRAEAEVAASVAAAAAFPPSDSFGSAPFSPSELASPPHTEDVAFGDSSDWGDGGDGDAGEAFEQPKAKASKSPSIPKRPSASLLASKLKGVIHSASERVSAMVSADDSKRERSKSKSKNALDEEEEEEDEEGGSAGVKSAKPVGKSRSFGSFAKQKSSEQLLDEEADDEMTSPRAGVGELVSPAAAAAVTHITVTPASPAPATSPTGLTPLPDTGKRRRGKDKVEDKEKEKGKEKEREKEDQAVIDAPRPPSRPPSPAAPVAEEVTAAPPTSTPSTSTAPSISATFPPSVDLDDPFGDKVHFDAEQQDAATAALESSFSTPSTAAWPPAHPQPASLTSAALSLPSEPRRRGSNASAASQPSASIPSFGAQPGVHERKDSFDSFDPFAPAPAPVPAPAPMQPQGLGAGAEDRGEAEGEEEWGSEPAGLMDSDHRAGPSISVDTSTHTHATSSIQPIPQLDPRENDFLQFRYAHPQSEKDEFLLQPPRTWLLQDSSLPLRSLDEAVTKATKKDNGVPRFKYIRQLILTSWAHRIDEEGESGGEEETVSAQGWVGLPELFKSLTARPVLKSTQVAYKALLLLHRLMQYGSPAVLGQLFVNRQFVLGLQQGWTDAEGLQGPATPASPIHDLLLPYSKYIMRRIYFIFQYRQFEGNFSLGYYLFRLFRHQGWPQAWTLPPTVTRDQVLALIQSMHDALTVAALVFEGGNAALGEEGNLLRHSILVPLMDDLYAMWLSATFLMNQLCLYTGTTCIIPGQPPHDAHHSNGAAHSSSSSPLSVNGVSISSPTTPHTPSIQLSTMTNTAPSAPEEDAVSQSLPAVIAHHRTITDRLHLFFKTVASLPSVSAYRRAPNLPGRVNPFQPTPPMHYPPPSNLPRVGLDNPTLTWRFQAQCIAVGETKRRLIEVDEDLARYQMMMEAEKAKQRGPVQQPAEAEAGKEDAEEEEEEQESEEEEEEPVQSPGDPNSPFYAARQALRAQELAQKQQQRQHQQQPHQSQPAAAAAPPVAVRRSIDNPFGDDDEEEIPGMQPTPSLQNGGLQQQLKQQQQAPAPDLMDFFSAGPPQRSAAQPNPQQPTAAVDFFSGAAQPQPPSMPTRPPQLSQSKQAPLVPSQPPLPLQPPAQVQLAAPAQSVAPLSPAPSSPPAHYSSLFSDEIDPADLSYTSIIGEGAASEVWSGVYQEHTDVAIRRFRPEIYGFDEGPEEFRRELEVLRKLRHPNVVLFMGACTAEGQPLSVVTELLDASLYRLLHESSETLTWPQWLQIALDAAKGLLYLHTAKPQPVVHGDLKSVNVLLDSHRRAKLADFLTARHKQRDEERGWQWTAPECLQGGEPSMAADVYGLGVILWELVTRAVPYADVKRGPKEVQAAVVQRNYRPPVPANCPAEYAALLHQCWAPKSQQRPPTAQVVEKITAMLSSAKRR